MSGILTRGWLALALVACTPTRNTAPAPSPAAVEAPAPTPAPELQPQVETAAVEADQVFLDQMIEHHQDGVKLAALGQSRALRPELKELASQIHQGQLREIDMMREWRTRWYGDPSEMPMDDLSTGHMPPHELPMGTGATAAGTPGAPGAPVPRDTTGTGGMADTTDTTGADGAPDPLLTATGASDLSALENAQGQDFDPLFLAQMIHHHDEGMRMIEEARAQIVHPEVQQLVDQMADTHRAELATMRQWQNAWATHTTN